MDPHLAELEGSILRNSLVSYHVRIRRHRGVELQYSCRQAVIVVDLPILIVNSHIKGERLAGHDFECGRKPFPVRVNKST